MVRCAVHFLKTSHADYLGERIKAPANVRVEAVGKRRDRRWYRWRDRVDGGCGFADFENGSPFTPSLRFRTVTASIALTPVAIGLLWYEGARVRPQDRDSGGSRSPGRWPQWPFWVEEVASLLTFPE